MIFSTKMHRSNNGFNLGNQLFVIAALLGMAKRYNTQLLFQKEWTYQNYFNLTDAIWGERPAYVFLREPRFSCCLDFFDKFKDAIKDEIVGIDGYLQSELYWENEKDIIRKNLSFNNAFYTSMQNLFTSYCIDINKIVAISVRRGDFKTDPLHYLLPREYYIYAYKEYFRDCTIFIFSDDMIWCRKNLSDISDTVFFADNMSNIEQLCLMSFFKNFIIANSTFSWWGAYLSTVANKKVVRPYHHFDGALKTTSIADHYPPSWIVFNHLK